jgi:hypothetical protein
MKKRIATFLLAVIFPISHTLAQTETELRTYYAMEIEVAYMVKFYSDLNPTLQNKYVGENEVEGQCGDYALLMALKFGCDLVIQNQTVDYLPNGIYRLVGEYLPDNQLRNVVHNHGRSGYWSHRGKIGTYHPILGFYELRLIQSGRFPTALGNFIDSKHVWNRLNGVMLDANYVDAGMLIR